MPNKKVRREVGRAARLGRRPAATTPTATKAQADESSPYVDDQAKAKVEDVKAKATEVIEGVKAKVKGGKSKGGGHHG